jgi:hypothetical protein
MTERIAIGDAPTWIKKHVLAVFVGLSAVLVVYVGVLVIGNAAAGWWPDGPPLSPRILISAVVVAALLNLARLRLAAGPLAKEDRSYYRWAVWFIGLYGLMGTWFLGPVVAGALLVHSLATDRSPE